MSGLAIHVRSVQSAGAAALLAIALTAAAPGGAARADGARATASVGAYVPYRVSVIGGSALSLSAPTPESGATSPDGGDLDSRLRAARQADLTLCVVGPPDGRTNLAANWRAAETVQAGGPAPVGANRPTAVQLALAPRADGLMMPEAFTPAASRLAASRLAASRLAASDPAASGTAPATSASAANAESADPGIGCVGGTGVRLHVGTDGEQAAPRGSAGILVVEVAPE